MKVNVLCTDLRFERGFEVLSYINTLFSHTIPNLIHTFYFFLNYIQVPISFYVFFDKRNCFILEENSFVVIVHKKRSCIVSAHAMEFQALDFFKALTKHKSLATRLVGIGRYIKALRLNRIATDCEYVIGISASHVHSSHQQTARDSALYLPTF